MPTLDLILLPGLACWDACAQDKLAAWGLAANAYAPGSLWRLIGVVGMAALVLSLLQCFRRRVGAAILLFLCGAGLLALTLGPGRHGWPRHVRVGPMPFVGFEVSVSSPDAAPVTDHETAPPLAEPSRPTEPLANSVDRLGGEFWAMKDEQLRHALDDARSILERSKGPFETAQQAEAEAYRRAAAQVRAYIQQLAADRAKWAEREIRQNQHDVEKGIAELLHELRDSRHVEVVTQSTGGDGKGPFRSVIRVQHPQDITAEYRKKVAETFDREIGPRGRRWAVTGVSLVLLSMLVYLAYLFVDAGTRGHFTWTLRIATVAAFVGICAALWYVVH